MIEIRKILHLPVDKLKTAGIILNKAFSQDPIFSYLIPDTKQRLKHLIIIFNMLSNMAYAMEKYTHLQI